MGRLPEQTTGDRVRLRRLEMGLTQEQLAQRAGVTISTIRNIERGRTDRSYRLPDVFRALGMLDDAEQRRLRDLLIAGGIDPDAATEAARIIVAERLTDPPRPPRSQPGNEAAGTA